MARPAATPYVVGDPARASLNTRDALLLDYSEEIGYRVVVNTQTGTTYTLVNADRGKVVECNNASAVTVTVPNSIFAAGDWLEVHQVGAGVVSLVAGSGVTFRPSTPQAVAAQWKSLRVRFRSASEAVIE